MFGSTIHSYIRLLGVVALVLGLMTPALAVPPANNPSQGLAAILAQIGPCNIPPVWGKKFAGADRFVAVLDGAAYCDQETGLVWEGSPDNTAGPLNNGTYTWTDAISHCARLKVDNRKGWALPMREQLATLVDTQSALCTDGGPCLPDDHPFSDVQSAVYWSAATSASDPALAWGVFFDIGDVSFNNKDNYRRAWCVRGGQAYDGQDVLNAVPAP